MKTANLRCLLAFLAAITTHNLALQAQTAGSGDSACKSPRKVAMKPYVSKLKAAQAGLFAILLLIVAEPVFAESGSGLDSEFNGPDTFWGGETNGIKVALLIQPFVSSNNLPIHCSPVIKSSIKGSNNLNEVWVYFPPLEYCCQLSLRDGNGNAVAKTSIGKTLGQAITKPLFLKGGRNVEAGYRMRPLMQNHSEVLSDYSFNLRDYFAMTNAGKYQLTFEMKIIPTPLKRQKLFSDPPPTITLPPVIAEVEIRPNLARPPSK